MALLKNHYINLAIVIAGIINAIIGGILIYSSFQGHSSFGIILGALIPLFALAFYGDGYRKYINFEITKDILKIIFYPSFKIGSTILVLILILLVWISISQGELAIDIENLIISTLLLLIFLIPNLVVQFGFYLFLKRKI